MADVMAGRTGLGLLVRLNADLLVSAGTLAAALALGAAIGGFLTQRAGMPGVF